MALRKAALSIAQRVAGAGGALEPSLAQIAGQSMETTGPICFETVRHASNQAVKQRIRAIKNIGKITKAMKMVAASKMRNAQVAVEGSRGICGPFIRLFGEYPDIRVKDSALVAVTSDRGLCGGLNANISKYCKAILKLYGPGPDGSDSKLNLVVIGDKGRSQLSRTNADNIVYTVAEAYKNKVTFAQCSLIAEEILKHNPEAIRIVFNKFRSAISFKPTVATVLSPEQSGRMMVTEKGNMLDAYELEVPAEKEDMMRDLVEFNLASTLYNALLENNCSEHASRMSAMENSTNNAADMLSRLTLSYNRTRQASITTELIEIIAGASALVDAD